MSSTQRKTALAFLETFKTLDGDTNVALRTPDCRHSMGPSSFSEREMNNEQFANHFAGVREPLVAFPVEVKEIFEAEGSNQITIWATSEAIFREEAKDDDPSIEWTYRGEYIWIFVFNEAGDKIRRIVEFIDSTKAIAVMELIQRARRNLAAKKEA